jgi:hypothetical protein
MPTRPVRFEFHRELPPLQLNFIHHLPHNLVTADIRAAQHDPHYTESFTYAVHRVIKDHEAAFPPKSSPLCEICGQHTTQMLYTPISWLHNVNDPFVFVSVSPVCSRTKCEIHIRQEMRDMMDVLKLDIMSKSFSIPRAPVELMPCKICGKMEDTKRCGRCGHVAYCGKEHQKKDWKLHKQTCTPKPSKPWMH